jgi:ATP-binding cassette, subfamily C, bacterial CydCD
MRPVDPRLLRYARSTRGFLIAAVGAGVVSAVLIIVQARLLSQVLVDVTANGAVWKLVVGSVVALAVVFVTRAALAWLIEVLAVRSSAKAKQELREAALDRILAQGPAGPAAQNPGEIAALLTRGIDSLDAYYARYLPQLVLAVIVPIAILATVLGQDLISAIIIAVTIPLIPIFMALIGMYTKTRVDRQWRTLASLSGHFLDLISGLPTLVIFGRAKAQADAIRAMGDRYRSSTMSVLRISFLSSFALELLASLSVALVAVSVGLRLAEGQIQYAPALFVLILAPEAFLPLRLVGQHFHAAAEGLGAAERIITEIESPLPVSGGSRRVPAQIRIEVRDVEIAYAGRDRTALAPTSFVAVPGSITAIVGSSGGGKSTLLAGLLGFAAPVRGEILVGPDQPLTDTDLVSWRSSIGWLPQNPHLISPSLDREPTIRGIIECGRIPRFSDEQLWQVLEEVGLAPQIRALTLGLDARLQADGSGLSVGQRQRLALSRALVGAPPVLLLDEPTAALDPVSEDLVSKSMRSAADAGAIVIVVAHRPAVIDLADQIVRVEAGALC